MEHVLRALEESPNGAFAVDPDQRIVLWNKEAERLLGWSAAEVIGRPCHEVIRGTRGTNGNPAMPVCGPGCPCIQSSHNDRTAPSQRVRTWTKDGAARWLAVTHVLLPSLKREEALLVHLVADVTQDIRARNLARRLATILEPNLESPMPEETTRSPSPAPYPPTLTPRERDILRLLVTGEGTAKIAQRLLITPTTVRNHIQRILTKLGAHNRLEAVACTLRWRLL